MTTNNESLKDAMYSISNTSSIVHTRPKTISEDSITLPGMDDVTYKAYDMLSFLGNLQSCCQPLNHLNDYNLLNKSNTTPPNLLSRMILPRGESYFSSS